MLTKKNSRKQIFLNILKYPIKVILYKVAEKNLKNYDQLAVYSLDFISLNIILDGIYEKKFLNMIDTWIERFHPKIYNGICLDIGANIGNHSIFYSKKFNQVFSFEVFPKNLDLLKINCRDIKNIKIFEFGLSNENKKIDFFYSKLNLGGLSKIKAEDQNIKLKLDVKKIDDLNIDKSKITFVKLDVEGSEFDIVKGGINFFSEYKPIIVFEQQPEDFEDNSTKLINLLKSLGYEKFYTIKTHPSVSESRNIFYKIFSFIMIILSGQKTIFYEIKEFKKGFYHMIIASR